MQTSHDDDHTSSKPAYSHQFCSVSTTLHQFCQTPHHIISSLSWITTTSYRHRHNRPLNTNDHQLRLTSQHQLIKSSTQTHFCLSSCASDFCSFNCRSLCRADICKRHIPTLNTAATVTASSQLHCTAAELLTVLLRQVFKWEKYENNRWQVTDSQRQRQRWKRRSQTDITRGQQWSTCYSAAEISHIQSNAIQSGW